MRLRLFIVFILLPLNLMGSDLDINDLNFVYRSDLNHKGEIQTKVVSNPELDRFILNSSKNSNEYKTQENRVSENLLKYNEFLSRAFGTPNSEDAGFNDFATDSSPISYIAPFLKKLTEYAAIALAIVFLISGIRASIDTAKEHELMGRSISAPFVAVRTMIAVFLLATMPGGYITLQNLILYSTFQISKGNDYAFSESIDAMIPDDAFNDLQDSEGVPLISRVEYMKLMNMALCQDSFPFIENGSGEELNSDDDIKYTETRGRKIIAAGRSFDGEYLYRALGVNWASDRLEGGCGAFLYNAIAPKLNGVDSSFVLNINRKAKDVINALVIKASSDLKKTLTQNSISSGVISLKMIAEKLGSTQEYKKEDIKRDFDDSWVGMNKLLGQSFKLQSTLLKNSISNELTNFKNEIKDQGWLMAGANLFRLVTVQSMMSALSSIKLEIYGFDKSAFNDHSLEEIERRIGFVATILDPSGAEGGGSSATANINKIDSSTLQIENSNNTKYCVMSMDDDCMGDSYIGKAIRMGEHLANNDSLHPLTYFHSFGLNGLNEIYWSYGTGLVAHTAAKTLGYSLISSPLFFLQSFGYVINDVSDRAFETYSTVWKVIGITFLMFSFFLPIAPMIAWMIVVIDWIVTIYIMLFAAPLFAVFHAIPNGHGFSSEYAQRGYPALLGAIFMPFFMLAGLFIYTILSTVGFKFIGMIMYLGIDHLRDISDVGLIGSVFIWIMILGVTLFLNNHLLVVITNFVDRVLRVLGVHEALTSNTTHLETSRVAEQSGGTVTTAAGQAARPIHSEGYLPSGGSRDLGAPPDKGGDFANSSNNNAHHNVAAENAKQETSNDVNVSQSENNNNISSDNSGYDPDSGKFHVNSKNESGQNNPSQNESRIKIDNVNEGETTPISSTEKRPNTALNMLKQGIRGYFGAGRNVAGTAEHQTHNQSKQDFDIPKDTAEPKNKVGDIFDVSNEQSKNGTNYSNVENKNNSNEKLNPQGSTNKGSKDDVISTKEVPVDNTAEEKIKENLNDDKIESENNLSRNKDTKRTLNRGDDKINFDDD